MEQSEKSVEELHISAQKFLEKIQRRRQHQSLRDRRTTSQPLSSLLLSDKALDGEGHANNVNRESKISNNSPNE